MKSGLVLLVLGATALLAADFWREKKFSEWSDQEVGRMLTDSPWARKATVQLAGRAALGDQRDESGDGVWGDQGLGSTPSSPSPPRTDVIVRWQTALPIRQAVARFHYGDQSGTSEKIAQMLNREEAYYIAGILGLPLWLTGPKPEDLKSAVVLHVKNRPPIRPLEILTEKLMRDAVNVFFFFPKMQSGARIIKLADEEVELVLRSPTMEIKRKFRLKDLLFDGKLEM